MSPSDSISDSYPGDAADSPSLAAENRRAVRTALSAMLGLLDNVADLVETMDPELYRDVGDPIFRSSPGGHIRHLLDHVRALLVGLRSAEALVCYDRRERGTDVENDRNCCLNTLREIRAELAEWSTRLESNSESAAAPESGPVADESMNGGAAVGDAAFAPERPLTVEQIVDPARDAILLQSTVLRELVFVFHHSVHHAATLAARMRAAGFAVPEHFGIAPATLAGGR